MILIYAQLWILRKEYGTSFSTTFCVRFLDKNISQITFHWLTKFHCLIPFTSWDIEQYVHYNYLFPQFMTSCILKLTLAFLSSHFPTWPKKSGQTFKYLRTKSEIKNIFIIFKGLSIGRNFLRSKCEPLTLKTFLSVF